MYRSPVLAKLVACTVVSGAFLTLFVSHCSAGMPSPLPDDIITYLSLSEEPKQRLQIISFFFFTFLASAFLVKCLWNGMTGEFRSLPPITYGKALLVTFGWGLMFCIVLVMVSGARELMTPGAWRKNGATYELQSIESAEESSKP